MAIIPIPLSVWECFDGEELPDLKIETLYEDRRGNLWVGTHDGGVVRFNGEGFITYNQKDGLCGNAVFSVLEDKEGYLWFGTNMGLSRFDGTRFETIAAKESHSYLWGSCCGHDGKLWFGLDRRPGKPLAISCWDGKALQLFEAGEKLDEGQSAQCVFADREGKIWIGGHGLYIYDGKFTCIAPAQSDLRQITDIVEGTGVLWLTSDSGLWSFDGVNFSQHLAEKASSLDSMTLARDKHNNLWFITADGRLFFYDTMPRLAFVFDLHLSHALCITKDGSLWVGTYGHGLYKFPIGRIGVLSERHGLADNSVREVTHDSQGRMYIATAQGVAEYTEDRITPIVGDERIRTTMTISVHADRQDRLWIGYFGGQISVWKQGRMGSPPGLVDQLSEAIVRCFGEDEKGRVWFGTKLGKGVGYYNEGQLHLIQEGPATWVGSLVEDLDGEIWVGSSAPRLDDRGLYRFNEEEGTFHRAAESADSISALCCNRSGGLWVGTTAGVLKWDGEELTPVPALASLATKSITSLHQTAKGVLWIGTDRYGVYVYDGRALQQIKLPGGLKSNITNQVYEDPTGQIWFATEGGLIRYTPRREKPQVHIASIETNNTHNEPRKEITVSALHASVVFHLDATNIAQGQVAYVYRLKKDRRGWRQTWDDTIECPALSPGKYTFEVMAVDQDLNYSPARQVAIAVVDHADFIGNPALKQRLIGTSAAMRDAWAFASQVANAELPVLILGETGVGKGVLAKLIHELSGRKDRPFIVVNCGAIPEKLVASKLFGHERGAFTGAAQQQRGSFELADTGTIFLDEIGDMPTEAQLHLLHVLQEGAFYRVGGVEEVEIDVKIIAATNKDMQQLVDGKAFREDLFYRLHGFHHRLPPLRERRQDILPIARSIIDRAAAKARISPPVLSREAARRLKAYQWPGNVRELEYVVQAALVHARDGGVIQTQHVHFWHAAYGLSRSSRVAMLGGVDAERPILSMEQAERQYISWVLAQTQGKVTGEEGAAQLLEMHPSTLKSRCRKLGIQPSAFMQEQENEL